MRKNSGKLTCGILFYFADIEDEKLWAISGGDFSGLYEMDLTTDRVICLGELPTKYRHEFNHVLEYMIVGKIKNEIVVFPYISMCDFIIYDVVSCRFKKISINKDLLNGINKTKGELFSNVFRWGNSLYFLANCCGIVVEYNSNDKSIIYHADWLSSVFNKIAPIDIATSLQGVVQLDSQVFMVIRGRNQILQFDFKTHETIIYDMPFAFEAYGLSFDGKWFWISSCHGDSVVKWDIADDGFKHIFIPSAMKLSYLYIGVVGEYLLLFPCYGNKFLAINRYDDSIDKFNGLDGYVKQISDIDIGKIGTFTCVITKNDKIYAMTKDRILHEFNVKTGTRKDHIQKLDQKSEIVIRGKSIVFWGKKLCYEALDMKVFTLIESIRYRKSNYPPTRSCLGVGKTIFDEIVRE